MRTLPVAMRHRVEVEEVAPRNQRDLSDRLDAALTRLGLQKKELEFWWGCSHQFVSMVLAGTKPLTDERIAQLPDHVQRGMAEEWCADLGLLTGSRAAAIGALQAGLHLLALDAIPLKMAHANLEPQAAEQPKRKRA